MTIKAFSLTSNVEYEFDDATTPEWAVAYAYCEENGLLSALFSATQRLRTEEFFTTLPIMRGAVSVACGDWACFIGGQVK